jgi:hypothetical protein
MGEKMNGDCDDYMLETYGIPSITAEMGHLNQYENDWKCVSPNACFDILDSNTKCMEYLFQNIGKVAAIVQSKRKGSYLADVLEQVLHALGIRVQDVVTIIWGIAFPIIYVLIQMTHF